MQLQEHLYAWRKVRYKKDFKKRNLSKITDNKTYLYTVSDCSTTIA